MAIEKLIESARLLQTPTTSSVNAFSHKRDEIAAQVSMAALARADSAGFEGSDLMHMLKKHNRQFSLFMEFSLYDFHSEIFVDTIIWALRNCRSYWIDALFWPNWLTAWRKVLKKNLPTSAFQEIFPFFNWLSIHIPDFAKLSRGLEKPNHKQRQYNKHAEIKQSGKGAKWL